MNQSNPRGSRPSGSTCLPRSPIPGVLVTEE